MVVLRSSTLKAVVLAAALGSAGTAQAHVSLQPHTGAGGRYVALRFQAGHGCGDKATTALRIEIPPGVGAARPQPKPGWKLEVAKAGDAVTAITWRGRLPADQFDEFLMLVRLPDHDGLLYFPAQQTCGRETVRWDEPQVGARGPAPKRPAPRIYVIPRQGTGPLAIPPVEPHHHQDPK